MHVWHISCLAVSTLGCALTQERRLLTLNPLDPFLSCELLLYILVTPCFSEMHFYRFEWMQQHATHIVVAHGECTQMRLSRSLNTASVQQNFLDTLDSSLHTSLCWPINAVRLFFSKYVWETAKQIKTSHCFYICPAVSLFVLSCAFSRYPIWPNLFRERTFVGKNACFFLVAISVYRMWIIVGVSVTVQVTKMPRNGTPNFPNIFGWQEIWNMPLSVSRSFCFFRHLQFPMYSTARFQKSLTQREVCFTRAWASWLAWNI